MLIDADLKKIKKLLAPLATKRDVGGSKNLGALWEKYAAIKIKLKEHESLIKELKKGVNLKVPNIEVSYLGVYPLEKFAGTSQEEFVDFVLTCYGASKNTADGETDGFRPSGQSEVIGEIKIKKMGERDYEFGAVDAFSTNEDGWLVNCQWDFDYQEGHFAADKEYILSREKAKDKKNGEHFVAVLKARHTFTQTGEVTVACKVQNNLAGEAVVSKIVKI